MRLAELVETSQRVAHAGGRLERIALLAALLRRVEPHEIEIAVAFLSGAPRQPKLGVRFGRLRFARSEQAAEAPTLTLSDVDQTLERVAQVGGKGSSDAKLRLLGDLFRSATVDEQRFLEHLIGGELRQGALEGLMVEAVAQAAAVPAATVRRAMMAAGELPSVARVALTEGAAAVARFAVQVFRPVVPMLAESAEDAPDALARLGRAALEFKLDGARIQVHKSGDEVKVFSRRLNEVTGAVPEVVAVTRALPARDLILDGEAIALRPDGTPLPFQTTMRRFGRKLEVERLRHEVPLSPFFFDLLYLDGAPLLDEPQERRFAALTALAPGALLVPHRVTASVAEAQAFLGAALARGHEGIMAKALEATYEAGSRGQR
ncbi:MAG TPA: hypothetical protein VH137_06840, partial [Gemmatimonadales bacterium]|nr:hypothetical protein [Gemmatimonadales bacterium]